MVGWLEQLKFISHTFKGWEIQDPGGIEKDFILIPLLLGYG